MFLALKVASSGLPTNEIPKGDPQYPWPCQIGAILFDDAGRRRGFVSTLVRAEGRKIPPGAVAVHGIDNRTAGQQGLSEIAAMAVVCGFAAQADYLVGFHVRFDRDVLESALIRLGKRTDMLVRPRLAVVDLVEPCSAICQIPGHPDFGTFKYPTMAVACERILGDPQQDEGAVRDAFAGAEAATRLFSELRRRSAIPNLPPVDLAGAA